MILCQPQGPDIFSRSGAGPGKLKIFRLWVQLHGEAHRAFFRLNMIETRASEWQKDGAAIDPGRFREAGIPWGALNLGFRSTSKLRDRAALQFPTQLHHCGGKSPKAPRDFTTQEASRVSTS